MATEVEETLKRLVGHKGVIGTVVVNKVSQPGHLPVTGGRELFVFSVLSLLAGSLWHEG